MSLSDGGCRWTVVDVAFGALGATGWCRWNTRPSPPLSGGRARHRSSSSYAPYLTACWCNLCVQRLTRKVVCKRAWRASVSVGVGIALSQVVVHLRLSIKPVSRDQSARSFLLTESRCVVCVRRVWAGGKRGGCRRSDARSVRRSASRAFLDWGGELSANYALANPHKGGPLE